MQDPAPLDHHELARVAFDLSPSGMLAVDGRGRIIAANREVERLFGWSREELAGQPIEILVPERYRDAHPGHRSGFQSDPHNRPMGAGRELHALRRDGSEFPVEIGLKPVTVAGASYVLASVVDITARRKLDEDQRRSQRLETIGILAGGIAHDFNNILLGIVGHTELALREGGASPQARDDLGHVLQAAGRGRQLVQRILTFSRDAESARLPVRLERIVTEVIQLLRASLPSTIEIRPRLDPATPTVLADETQFHQILMNVATNSAHAMPAGGVLEIALGPHPVEAVRGASDAGATPVLYARLRVSDTGVGMPPEVLEHALEPFFTTKPVGQGTGLGLSVVHGIVSSHHGRMEISSAPLSGTTITIDLPAAEGAAAADAAPRAPGASERRRRRVLFVEDEPVLALMQRRQLEHLGFDVTVHTGSLEALEDFRARPDYFELMITDDTMPHMTGTSLAREIGTLRPDLPVLMVSGGDRSQSAGPPPVGLRKILRKPHTLAELEAAIREVIEGGGPGPGAPR